MGSFYDLLLASKLSGGGGGGGGGASAENELIDGTLSGAFSNHIVTTVREQAFSNITNITSLHLQSVTIVKGSCVENCGLTSIVLPSIRDFEKGYSLQKANSLKAVDIGGQLSSFNTYLFNGDGALDTLILRGNAITPLTSPNVFNGTPFKNGGTGGEIYVPSALLSSYPTASNWSTINGYGTITWKAIEGSYYETHYADGTPIS